MREREVDSSELIPIAGREYRCGKVDGGEGAGFFWGEGKISIGHRKFGGERKIDCLNKKIVRSKSWN